MPMYALATVPLIQELSSSSQVIQTWYADDASAAGQLCNIQIWWKHINKMGPKFGYFFNGAKSWLVMKNECLQGYKYTDFIKGPSLIGVSDRVL